MKEELTTAIQDYFEEVGTTVTAEQAEGLADYLAERGWNIQDALPAKPRFATGGLTSGDTTHELTQPRESLRKRK